MIYNSIIYAQTPVKFKGKTEEQVHTTHGAEERRRNREMKDSEQDPPSIRDSRVLLGLEPNQVTKERIIAAWKQKLIACSKTAHIENNAYLICLNQAKEDHDLQ